MGGAMSSPDYGEYLLYRASMGFCHPGDGLPAVDRDPEADDEDEPDDESETE